MKSQRIGPLWWLVALGVGAGLVFIAGGRLTLGGDVMAASLVVAALGRAGLDSDRADGVVVRSKVTDVAMYLFLAAVLFGFVHQLRAPFPLPG